MDSSCVVLNKSRLYGKTAQRKVFFFVYGTKELPKFSCRSCYDKLTINDWKSALTSKISRLNLL